MQPNGNLIALPQNGIASRKSGLFVYIDTHWANGYGYRPVEVRVQSPKPTTADHSITIRLHTGDDNDFCVEQEFEIPLGATKASTTVAFPTYDQTMSYFWWEVWVDGIKDLDLSLDKQDGWQSYGGAGTSPTGVEILVAGPEVNHKSLVVPMGFDFEVLSLKLGEFPRRWIDYTCLDVVSLSIAELNLLAQTNPAALEAIEQWVRSGGQLWVSDVGGKLEQLPQVAKLLRMPEALASPSDGAEKNKPSDKENDKPIADNENRSIPMGWTAAHVGPNAPGGRLQVFIDNRTGRTQWASDPRAIAALQQNANYTMAGPQVASGNMNPELKGVQDSSRWFLDHRLGFGVVRVFRGANEASSFAQLARWNPNAAANANLTGQIPPALALAIGATPHWEARHGIVPDSSNPEFAKLLVPGVGQAPVIQFQVLITLFVLLIGPVNYWLLKRSKRLQLLVLTVPLAAGAATAALFAYAMVSDGFGTMVRARSVTMLDQRSGEAACWARLSYYSGMAPGRGLTMPDDVVVYPVLPSWSTDSSRAIDREVLWNGNDAKLTRGWLLSRTPTQYLTQRVRKTPHRLDVVSGAGKVQVTNRLETQIDWLVVINEAGAFFAGKQLANDSRTVLQAIPREDAVKQFIQLVKDNEPKAPEALAASDLDFSSRRGRMGRRMYGRFRSQANADQWIEGLTSRMLSDLTGMSGQPALDLPPRSYVAVTASGPEVEIGIPHAEEEASFHVIVGQW